MGAILKDLKLTDVGGSATEVVTVQEVKDYLQIEGTAYDGPIGIFITAARQMVEGLCGVSLMQKTAIATIHATGRRFTLPRYPVTAITQVRWKKCPSEWVALVADEDYDKSGQSVVEIESSEVGLHEVTYTLGVDERPVFQQAIIAQAGYMFNNRDSERMVVKNAGGSVINMNMAPEVNALLQSYFNIA